MIGEVIGEATTTVPSNPVINVWVFITARQKSDLVQEGGVVSTVQLSVAYRDWYLL
jgi:hypothetical protein